MTASGYRDAFSDAALEAAASRGLLRRAERDVAAGLARLVTRTDASAEIEVDGAVVTLLPSGVKAARCTCPSREICRHVLAAALLVRGLAEPAAAPPPPDVLAEIKALTVAELERGFGAAALRAGAKLAAASAAADIRVDGAACRISLPGQPEVVYSAGQGIPGMLSRAPASRARTLHAAALLAVRGDAVAPPEAAAAPPDPEFLRLIRAALLDAAQSALGPAPRALEDRLLDLAISARAEAIPALSALLRQCAGRVAARRTRDPGFDPVAALSLLARTFALAEALGSSAGAQQRGAARQPFDETFEALELVGCGLDVFHAGSGARGATAHFYAPALDRWFSASLARAAGQDPAFSPETAARNANEIWGHTLASVGSARVRLSRAVASPGGRLSLGQKTSAALAPLALDEADFAAWPSVCRDWDSLRRTLVGQFSPSLQRRDRAVLPLILWPTAIGAVRFDDAAQLLVLPVQDISGRWMGLTTARGGGQLLDETVETFAGDAGRRGRRLVFALASESGARFRIQPFGATTDDFAEVVSFALARRPVRQVGANPGPDPPRAVWAASSGATGRLLSAVLDEMVGFCELGGLMQDPDRLQRVHDLARLAENLGLEPLSRALLGVHTADPRQRAAAVLVAVHIAQAFAGLRRGLPMLAGLPGRG